MVKMLGDKKSEEHVSEETGQKVWDIPAIHPPDLEERAVKYYKAVWLPISQSGHFEVFPAPSKPVSMHTCS